MQNRPWGIWWDFSWELDETGPSHIIVQTDHPKYQNVDYIYRFAIQDCEDDSGYIDSWEENWFKPFRADVLSGRISINSIMKGKK